MRFYSCFDHFDPLQLFCKLEIRQKRVNMRKNISVAHISFIFVRFSVIDKITALSFFFTSWHLVSTLTFDVWHLKRFGSVFLQVLFVDINVGFSFRSFHWEWSWNVRFCNSKTNLDEEKLQSGKIPEDPHQNSRLNSLNLLSSDCLCRYGDSQQMFQWSGSVGSLRPLQRNHSVHRTGTAGRITGKTF